MRATELIATHSNTDFDGFAAMVAAHKLYPEADMVLSGAVNRNVREFRTLFADEIPVVAAVNGPAVGLGCSLVALSDIVYMAETAYLADPHVRVGLVAADGGPLTWPLHTSLLHAKEYALTGARIPARRAAEMGLANHVVPDPLAAARQCATQIAGLARQAVESTKRLLNLHLERAVLATLDFATTAEEQSFQTDDFRLTLAKLTRGKAS